MVKKESGAGPLYRQVADALRSEIEVQLEPGALIATEPALEQRFGVSRSTVRRAIEELARAGLLLRRQGSGTYVTRPRVTEELGVLQGWTDGMRAQGLEPRTVDCDMMLVLAPPWVEEALGGASGAPEPVLRIQRLRYADDEPLCLMVDYLLPRYVPHLLEEGLMNESLYATLIERYGLQLARAEDTVTAREATRFEAALLGVALAAPILYVTRVTYLAGGGPVGAATVVSRGDRYTYRVSGRPGLRPHR